MSPFSHETLIACYDDGSTLVLEHNLSDAPPIEVNPTGEEYIEWFWDIADTIENAGGMRIILRPPVPPGDKS